MLEKKQLIKEVAKQIVVELIGDEVLIFFNRIITLNKTGKFLWKLLQQETKIDQLVEALCDAYEVIEKQHIKL